MNERAERRRQLRDQLRAMTPEQKRQLLREFLRWVFAVFGVRVASADELTGQRIWGRWGCLQVVVSLALLTTAIVLMARNDVTSWNMLLGALIAAALVWYGIALLRTFARHVRRKAAGHTGMATVVDHEVIDDAGVARFTALVDITTRSGEARRRVAFDRRELPSLIDRVSARSARFESDGVDPTAEPAPLPVGTRFAVVIDPRDPDRIERTSAWSDALRLIGGVAALALGVAIAVQLDK